MLVPFFREIANHPQFCWVIIVTSIIFGTSALIVGSDIPAGEKIVGAGIILILIAVLFLALLGWYNKL